MDWLITVAAGAAGFYFITPIAQSLVAKLFPTAGSTTQTALTAVAGAAGVIAGLWIGKEFFGRSVKEV